jgi:type II secretory pathway component GspD/PulD (secretin)
VILDGFQQIDGRVDTRNLGTRRRQMVRRVSLLVWLLLAAAFAQPGAAQGARVYEVRHRTAEELAPIVETALAGEGRVVADRRTNQLVLTGSPRAIATALELLAALDVRTRTVVLRYETRTTSDLSAAGASVRWRAGAGDFRIGDVSWPGAGPARIAVSADARRDRGAESLAGELRILDGQTGRIASGDAVPVTTRRIRRGSHGAVVDASTQYVSFDSGFEATPRVLRGGGIELRLRPFDAELASGGTVRRASADTVLVLQPGKTVALGGIVRGERDSYRSAASGVGDRDRAHESVLLVTAGIE